MQPGRNQPLKKIVAEALHEWLEAQEDAELLPEIEAARAEWLQKGGRPWEIVEREIQEEIDRREAVGTATSNVSD